MSKTTQMLLKFVADTLEILVRDLTGDKRKRLRQHTTPSKPMIMNQNIIVKVPVKSLNIN
jgi:hypothetical protein